MEFSKSEFWNLSKKILKSLDFEFSDPKSKKKKRLRIKKKLLAELNNFELMFWNVIQFIFFFRILGLSNQSSGIFYKIF